MRRPAVLGILVALVWSASPAVAEPGPFARFLGGGRATTDCMLVIDVAGVSGGGRARSARCTDGDPACDVDGSTGGQCVFRARVCLDAAAPPRCHADMVTAADVTSPDPALADLASALHAVAMPVDVPDTCTAAVDVPVPTRGRRIGRLVLPATATMASGHLDRDRVTLVCRRARTGAPGTTFAAVERVFTRNCATASCHGVAAAGGLGLASGQAYANLVNVPATNAVAAAAGVLRVVPGDPVSSFLLRKITGELAPDEGQRMPQIGPPLGGAGVDLVRRWIAAGAPADARF